MMQTSERIEKYLNGEMNQKELVAFEKELEADKALFGEYQLRKEVETAILDDHALKIQNTLDEIMAEPAANPKIRAFKKNAFVLKIAASVVGFMIIASAVLYFVFNNNQRDQLFMEYYQASDAVMIVRSGNSKADGSLIQGMQAYDASDYNRAVELLNQVDENVTATFYTALSYVELKKYIEAEKAFQKIIKQGNNLFVDQAEWYSALLKLKIGETEQARLAFIDISNSNSFYNIKASRILVKLPE